MDTTPPSTAVAPICCTECGRVWAAAEERWRIKVLYEEYPPEAVPYCPECHAREFEAD